MSPVKVVLLVILSGITTGIGAFFGSMVGSVSQSVIAMCLAFAAGAMLYIVTGELTPEANSLYKGRMTALGNVLGFLIRNNCSKNIKFNIAQKRDNRFKVVYYLYYIKICDYFRPRSCSRLALSTSSFFVISISSSKLQSGLSF